MRYRERRERPVEWTECRKQARHRWTVPFVAVEYGWEWAAHFLSNWAFLEALEYLSSFGVLIAVIFYFAESGERTRQRHLQMWQVMNTAQGKGGSGGRIEALQDLNNDKVPLVGVDVSGAFLREVKLRKAELLRANFSAVDARDGDFSGADLHDANLHGALWKGIKSVKGANIVGVKDAPQGFVAWAVKNGAVQT